MTVKNTVPFFVKKVVNTATALLPENPQLSQN